MRQTSRTPPAEIVNTVSYSTSLTNLNLHKKHLNLRRKCSRHSEKFTKSSQEGKFIQIVICHKTKVSIMSSGSNNTDMSVGASDQPACWTPGLVLVVANFVDKINKPQAGRHHSTRVCRSWGRRSYSRSFINSLYIILVAELSPNVIIWTNKILLVWKTEWNDSLWNRPSFSGQ